MSNQSTRAPMLDMYLFETSQMVEQLEQLVLSSEKENGLSASINEIFRIMHTIKGSSAMMLFNNISSLAHSVEDVFYYLRENNPEQVEYSELTDLILDCIDFFKGELEKIENDQKADGDSGVLIDSTKSFLARLTGSSAPIEHTPKGKRKQQYYIGAYQPPNDMPLTQYEAVMYFEDGCEMENIRAFTVVHNLKDEVSNLQFSPSDIIENNDSVEMIRQEGFHLWFSSERSLEDLKAYFEKETLFLKEIQLWMVGQKNQQTESRPNKIEQSKKQINLGENVAMAHPAAVPKESETAPASERPQASGGNKQNFISVNIPKVDRLMDLVGELVIAEAMVTKNPELQGLQLDSFSKAARQLRKIAGELQDIVMSIRMVPLSMTFQKMNRIVRDMSKKLGKEVELEVIGEETEVDKNIIEKISDPLMHLIRNAIDHGLETAGERAAKGKAAMGKVVLEAKNAGGEVWIIVKDDGKGLDREKILQKAREHGLVHKPESEMSDKEVYSIILLPGFSTKENVTEFSGRGVGMDVVAKNIESVGGTVSVDSVKDQGTTIIIKIPLTLAIVDGMLIQVGKSVYTIPTTSIRQSFRVKEQEIIHDTEGNEMLLVRGVCYPVLRLHRLYKVQGAVTTPEDGIMIMVEEGGTGVCLFADVLLGEQQVVIKALPKYIKRIRGITGCTLLGDGSISLILDIAGLIGIQQC